MSSTGTDLEVQCPLVGQVGLVSSQGYYDVGTGLSLELLHPVLRPHKRLLALGRGKGTQSVKSGNNIREYTSMGFLYLYGQESGLNERERD